MHWICIREFRIYRRIVSDLRLVARRCSTVMLHINFLANLLKFCSCLWWVFTCGIGIVNLCLKLHFCGLYILIAENSGTEHQIKTCNQVIFWALIQLLFNIFECFTSMNITFGDRTVAETESNRKRNNVGQNMIAIEIFYNIPFILQLESLLFPLKYISTKATEMHPSARFSSNFEWHSGVTSAIRRRNKIKRLFSCSANSLGQLLLTVWNDQKFIWNQSII